MSPESVQNLLFLIPLLPFLGFLVNGLFGARLPRGMVSFIGCAAPAGAALIGVMAFSTLTSMSPDSAISKQLWDWIAVSDLQIAFGLRMDRLAAVMTLVVTGVGTLIHIYSVGYMAKDSGYHRFFAFLNLFTAAMLILVLGDNIALMFLGWEGVGLCSYLLISFWYKEIPNCRAGNKAFIVNRVGDFGFLLGIFLIFVTFGTVDFQEINSRAADINGSTLLGIALLLMLGAAGKSAQIPLYVWLPDAMAGPTPVSALIHAATMVTSGVYMVTRLGVVFSGAHGEWLGMTISAGGIMGTVGAGTLLLAAIIAFSQNDIKKVLAYSTVSQLGYMFLAAGLQAYGTAMFHLVTHAFFKALLFLGAGAVIHSMHHEQDMRRMGGLVKKIPKTTGVFIIGALALAGFPLTAGFFSKDAILHEALYKSFYDPAGAHAGWMVLWGVGIAGALCTAIYTFRQVAVVFFGNYRGADPVAADGKEAEGNRSDVAASDGAHAQHALPESEIHESPSSMLLPLYVLAALSLAGGFLNVGGFLFPEVQPHPEGHAFGLFLGSAIAIIGIGAALYLFLKNTQLVETLTHKFAPGRVLTHLSIKKFYVDEFYDRVFVRPLQSISILLFFLIDRALIDWILVGGSGALVRGLGLLFRKLQSGRMPAYTACFAVGAVGILVYLIW